MKLGEFIQSNFEAQKHWRRYWQAKRANEALATSIGADESLDDAADMAAASVAPKLLELGVRDDYGTDYRAFIAQRYGEYAASHITMGREMQSILSLYFKDPMETRIREISNTTYASEAEHKQAIEEQRQLRAILEAMDKPVAEKFPRGILAALKMTEEALRQAFKLARNAL